MRIIHIDDNEEFLELTKATLNRFYPHYQIYSTTDPNFLFNGCQLDSFDVILCDYQMPEINGLEVLKRLKENEDNTPNLIFIMFTGKGREEVAMKALNLGANFYLQKGRDLETVFTELNHYITLALEHRKQAIERTLFARKLKSEKDLFTAISELSPVGILTFSALGKVEFVNQHAEVILGLPKAEILHRWYNSVEWGLSDFSGRPLTEDKLAFRMAVDNQKPVFGIQHSVLRPSGERIYLEVNMSPLLDDQNQIKAVLATFHDITDQIRVENALNESLVTNRNIVSQIPVGILIYRLTTANNLILTDSNKTTDILLGIKTKAFVGKTIEEVFPNLDHTEVVATFKRIAREGGDFTINNYSYADNQVAGVYDVTAFQTEPNKVTVAFVDITDRIRNQQELDERRRWFETILNSICDAVVTTDNQGLVTFINPPAEELTGWVAEEALRKPRSEILKLSNEEREVFLTQQSGRQIPISITETPIIMEEKDVGSTIVFRDITSYRNERETNHLLSELLHHDVKNKTAVVEGYLALIKTSDADRERLVDKSLEALRDSLDLINKIRSLYQVALHREGEPVDLCAILEDEVDSWRPLAEEAGVSISLSCSNGELVLGSPLLSEVFANIIQNGIIHSKCNKLVIAVARYDDRLIVRIEDNGVGVPHHFLPKIFDKNFKGENSSGTGIGLFLVKQIVEIVGGRITIESNVGEGTVFKVQLRRYTSS